jgi:hypothetical protein
MTRLTRALVVPLLLATLFAAPPLAAQSAQSVVDEMKARHKDQLETVDNYVIETNLYTAYHRKVTRNGQTTYETATRMSGQSETLNALGTTPTTTSGVAYLDRLAAHATYDGTESINGAQSHVLRISDPGAVFDEMTDEVEEMVYYVHADTYAPSRMMVTMARQSGGDQSPTMTINYRDYRTVDGLTLPYVMEMVMDLGMGEEQRRQLQQLQEKLEQMPEQQREQMKRVMGKQFEQMQNMMAGEPTTVEVQSVRVNDGIPEGIFAEADSDS